MGVLIDTHAHLDDEQFTDDLQSVLQRAADAGIERIIAIGTTRASSVATVRLAQTHDCVWAAVGIQPNYVAEASDREWDEISQLARENRVVAIGETGLDWYWNHAPIELQREYFRRHLDLSESTRKPFIVHMREPNDPVPTSENQPKSCCEDIVRIVESVAKRERLHGVMHSYTGNTTMAHRFCDLGLHISFAGMVTFKKSHALREVAAATPLDRILVETDAPYLSPEPKRGQRPNEPSLVVHTAACIAEARGETLDEFSAATTRNARDLFWS